MKRVILETPFAAPRLSEIEQNISFARACVADCLHRGEAPFASHLLYTQEGILRDELPEERALGMNAGFAWVAAAECSVVYLDRGVSRGMLVGIHQRLTQGGEVEFRQLTNNEVSLQAVSVDSAVPGPALSGPALLEAIRDAAAPFPQVTFRSPEEEHSPFAQDIKALRMETGWGITPAARFLEQHRRDLKAALAAFHRGERPDSSWGSL